MTYRTNKYESPAGPITPNLPNMLCGPYRTWGTCAEQAENVTPESDHVDSWWCPQCDFVAKSYSTYPWGKSKYPIDTCFLRPCPKPLVLSDSDEFLRTIARCVSEHRKPMLHEVLRWQIADFEDQLHNKIFEALKTTLDPYLIGLVDLGAEKDQVVAEWRYKYCPLNEYKVAHDAMVSMGLAGVL